MMKQATMIIGLTLTLLLSAACNQQQSAGTNETAAAPAVTAQPSSLTPEELGELGAQIRNEPARADEILAKRNMTRESFEKSIRDITENPDASKRYAEAYNRSVKS